MLIADKQEWNFFFKGLKFMFMTNEEGDLRIVVLFKGGGGMFILYGLQEKIM